MDISQITDLNVLKSMAFDQIVARDSADQNLRLLNARINEIKNQVARTEPTTKETK